MRIFAKFNLKHQMPYPPHWRGFQLFVYWILGMILEGESLTQNINI